MGELPALSVGRSSPIDMSMRLSSAAFAHEGAIPARFTCDADDTSPPLSWRDVPEEAQSLALIVADPDAPDPAAPKRTWAHWVLYDLPPVDGALAEGTQELPPGTRDGLNDWMRTGYGGPCPPIGEHRYYFELYALDRLLGDRGTPTRPQLLEMMAGHILERATLMGVYRRPGR